MNEDDLVEEQARFQAAEFELCELRKELAELKLELQNAKEIEVKLVALQEELKSLKDTNSDLARENATVSYLQGLLNHKESVLASVTSSPSFKITQKIVSILRKIPGANRIKSFASRFI